MKFSQKENFRILSNAPLGFIFEITYRIWSIGKTMPLNIEHSLEHVSTSSASSEDYYHQTFHAKLAYSLEQNTEGGGSTPILEGTLKCTALKTPLFSSFLTQRPLKIMLSTKDPVFLEFLIKNGKKKKIN